MNYKSSVDADRLGRLLAEKLTALGPDYLPRTRHLNSDGSPVYTNRLILEASPYLLQHAHNPVNWFPWGDEAFSVARERNIPIFLSIGYSTCHWCHVMEHESFENADIADLLNREFVAVKVDREQRPDLDSIYMLAVTLLTGQGGWPMSTFLTPDGKPFYGGTYYHPTQFSGLLQQITGLWKKDRDSVIKQADELSAAIDRASESEKSLVEIGEKNIQKAVIDILGKLDHENGGFGFAPKFPNEPLLMLLLARVSRKTNSKIWHVITKCLDAMANGGIYDQIGGGFHRYTVDNAWLVPHFEKMLYNQANLTSVYLQAWRLSGEQKYRRIVIESLDYLLKEMQSPAGGFYSATDADSEGQEGTFFIWTPAQIRAALEPDLAKLALRLYGVTDEGNFEGKSILYLPKSLSELATDLNLPITELIEQQNKVKRRLYRIRATRVSPFRDDKIIVSWNGMLIASLAMASVELNKSAYLQSALSTAEFIWENAVDDGDHLLRVGVGEIFSVAAMQEDYACLGQACVRLFDATRDELWLDRANRLTKRMIGEFWDDEKGGFFMNSATVHSNLLGRPKDTADGAIPSGNAEALRVLQLLYARTGDEVLLSKARSAVASYAVQIEEHPSAFASTLAALDELLQGESGHAVYFSQGKIKMSGKTIYMAEGEWQLMLELSLAEGWSVVADALNQANIAANIRLAEGAEHFQIDAIDFDRQQSKRKKVGEDWLIVFEKGIKLCISISAGSQVSVPTVIALIPGVQICSDKICLAANNQAIYLPLVSY